MNVNSNSVTLLLFEKKSVVLSSGSQSNVYLLFVIEA